MKKKRILILTILLSLLLACSSNDIVNATENYEDILFIDNFSFETNNGSDSNTPSGWTANNWGENIATFTYLDEGYTGNHSVKVELEEYIDGDAKWFFSPISIAAGDYIFSDYYRSSVASKVVVAITTDTETQEFMNLPNAPASKDWSKYEASFIMPENAVTATVYHLLSKDGYLVTDDYQIKSYKHEGFDYGMLTISFDDGWNVNSTTALPIMEKFGYKSNQFYATTFIQNSQIPNPKELIQLFIDAGHEIGSHSTNHMDLTALSQQDAVSDIAESKFFLESYLDISIDYFAAPFGIYDAFVNENIMKFYKAHRTVDVGYNSKDNYNISHLKCIPVVMSTTTEDIEEWAQKAKEEKLWLVLLFHDVSDNVGDYGTTPELFLEYMQVIDDVDIPVVTISEAIAIIEAE